MAKGRKRIRTGALFALITGIILAGYSCLAVYSEPELLEYTFSAGHITTSVDDTGVETFQSDLDEQLKVFAIIPARLKEAAAGVSLTGDVQTTVLINEQKKAVSTPLVALSENAFDAFPRFLRWGRLFYPDELEQGAFVMLIDEELALALFQTIHAEGRNVTLAEESYRIIGVLRHNRRVGEANDFTAYIPLKTAQLSCLQLDTLTLRAIPIQSAEAMATFQRIASELSPKGTFYNSIREKTGATFLVRLVLCGFYFVLLHAALRHLATSVKRFRKECARRFQRAYLSQTLPFIFINAAWRFVALAAIITAAAAVLVILVQPVYVYTDYIPSVLVEPKEIIKTFWNAQSKEASRIVYHTVSANRMKFFAGLSRWGSILALYGLLRVRRPPIDQTA